MIFFIKKRYISSSVINNKHLYSALAFVSIHPDIDRPASSTVNGLKTVLAFTFFQHYFCICQYGSRTFDVENAGKAKTRRRGQ